VSTDSRIILGVDPGTNLLGYGIVRIEGKAMELLAVGVVKLSKLEDHGEKLHHIFERISGLIEGYQATEVAIEAPFFGKNVQSMLKLGRAQGVAIAAAISKGLKVYEYEPRRIKQSITGNGNASKEQVSSMIQTLLTFTEKPETSDATDAVAAAVCHYFQANPKQFGQKKGSSGGGWKQFVTNNPDKIKRG
jgi:crossover junction endodeoxyribonuclease RuvC